MKVKQYYTDIVERLAIAMYRTSETYVEGLDNLTPDEKLERGRRYAEAMDHLSSAFDHMFDIWGKLKAIEENE